MDVKEAFAIVIVEQRKMLGFSQERLALEANIDRSYMSKLERGLYQPSLDKILSFARAFGIRPGILVDRVDELMNEAKK